MEQIKSKLSEKYNIPSEKLFQEENHNPYIHFEQIDTLDLELKKLLNEGKTQESQIIIQQIEVLLGEINKIIGYTNKGFEIFDGKKNTILEVQRGIFTDTQDAFKIVDTIKRIWSSEVLKLGQGDILHPNSDGDILNNITEIEDNNNQLSIILGQAQDFLNQGASIKAIYELNRCEATNEDSQYRLREIKEKYQRLQDTDNKNNSLLQEANLRLSKLASSQTEIFITIPTKEKFLEILGKKSHVEPNVNQEKRNPFTINIELQSLLKDISECEEWLKRDYQSYEYLKKELLSTDLILSQLEQEGKKSQYDNYPDGKEAIKIFGQIPSFRSEYQNLYAKLNMKHQDWNILLKYVENVLKNIRIGVNVLREDSDNRRKAEESIEKAKRKIQEARNWSGSYGITLSSNYGVSHFSQAEQAYIKGDFNGVLRLALDSYNSASHAIHVADNAVRTEKRRREEQEEARRREERRKQEEEDDRRRRMSSSSSSSSNSGFGGGGSFGGGSSGFGGGGSW